MFKGTGIRSSSSITADRHRSCFEILAVPFEVDMLARLCLAKALKGEVLLFPDRRSVVMDMPRFCAGAGTEDGTEEEVGEVDAAEEDTLLGSKAQQRRNVDVEDRRLQGKEGVIDWTLLKSSRPNQGVLL